MDQQCQPSSHCWAKYFLLIVIAGFKSDLVSKCCSSVEQVCQNEKFLYAQRTKLLNKSHDLKDNKN